MYSQVYTVWGYPASTLISYIPGPPPQKKKKKKKEEERKKRKRRRKKKEERKRRKKKKKKKEKEKKAVWWNFSTLQFKNVTCWDVRVQILIRFQTFLLFTKPYFQTFNAVGMLLKAYVQAFQIILDVFSPLHMYWLHWIKPNQIK